MKNALLSSTGLAPHGAAASASFGGTGATVAYTVTQTGTYTIVADGAQGGGSHDPATNGIDPGGLGAVVSGSFALVAGETIEISVGIAGGQATGRPGLQSYYTGGGGGGGGTFVELIDGGTRTLLEVAGGGGGSSGIFAGQSATAGAAGSGSGGAYVNVNGDNGAGGGGISGSGRGQSGTNYAVGGQSYGNGLAGGAGGRSVYGPGGTGGFGGGGGGGGYTGQYFTLNQELTAGGGGGGFTGGASGAGVSGGAATSYAGYAGTSYVNAIATGGSEATATQTGNGAVTITEQACFAAGTRIETDRGPVAVELLREGDYVRLAREEAFVPVAWMGHRTVDCACHPRPDAIMPVRVRAHAFGPGLPARDLILSPDHAVFVDDVLIPVRHLMNGATILRERRPSVTYWHIELDRHDVLLAEGLPCESYLDTGNRAAFANGGPVVSAHPQFDPVHAMGVWKADACATLVTGGVARDAVHALLLATAADLGYELTDQPAIALSVDGRVIRPTPVAGLLRFELPAGARDIRLTSRRFVPAELFTGRDDRRALGAAIAEIWVDGLLIEMTELDPADGWFAPETDAMAEWRWTDGNAKLRFAGARVIDIENLPAGYYWTSPAIVGAELSRAA